MFDAVWNDANDAMCKHLRSIVTERERETESGDTPRFSAGGCGRARGGAGWSRVVLGVLLGLRSRARPGVR